MAALSALGLASRQCYLDDQRLDTVKREACARAGGQLLQLGGGSSNLVCSKVDVVSPVPSTTETVGIRP